jgi:NAD(P)-dependent dehydrogenase (short-subunit alcohol dehydrogenase family)
MYAYRATKAGANAVMKSMAVDLADQGITAVAIHPGWVRTDMGGPGATLDVESSVHGCA